MKLIVISNPQPVIDESNLINQLFDAGLKYFHLRKPDSEFETVRCLLEQIKSEYYPFISLHQHHQLAINFGINRIHYTEVNRNNLISEHFIKQVKDGLHLSTSVHAIKTLQSLQDFDYAFYGPVFNSISKHNYISSLPTNFKLEKENINIEVIGLGGIEASNIHLAEQMNFDGVAVLGSIWQYPAKAVTQFEEFQNLIYKHNKDD